MAVAGHRSFSPDSAPADQRILLDRGFGAGVIGRSGVGGGSGGNGSGATYTSSTFPAAGVKIPTNSSGSPTQPITIDPVNGAITVTIQFKPFDNEDPEADDDGRSAILIIKMNYLLYLL